MKKDDRILIIVQGGTVTSVITEQQCQVLIVDHDVDGIIPEGQVLFEGMAAYVPSQEMTEPQPERLQKAYTQFNR